jgi:hypothetical protein
MLACKACGAPVEPGDDGYARCRFCGGVARLAPHAGAAATDPTTIPRPPIDVPRGVTVVDTGRGLEITRRWFHPAAIFLAFFAAVWIGLLATFYGMATGSGAPLPILLFPLLHVAVGLGLAYGALAMFVNRTLVRAESGTLSVTHGPLPWRPGPTLASGAVSQVFTREDASKKNQGSPTYSVWAVRKDGGRVRLAGTIPSADTALFLEQTIERHLEIADRAVPGEVFRA